MVELINEYIEQHQLVEAMESIDYPRDAEEEYLIKLGNEIGEFIHLDRKAKKMRKQSIICSCKIG